MDEEPYFRKGEKVQANNRGVLYDALIMEVVHKIDEADKYRVHYIGWRKTHDEVLDKMKIIKIDETPQNYAKVIDVVKKNIPASVVKKSHKKKIVDSPDKKVSALPKSQEVLRKPDEKSNVGEVKKLNDAKGTIAKIAVSDFSQTHVTPAQVGSADPAFWEYKFEITMPNSIMRYLLEQEEILSESTNERLLPPLPWQSKMPTCAKILELFLAKFANGESYQGHKSVEFQRFPPHDVLKDIKGMLSEHFNKMLPVMLLYPLEWRQYESLCQSGSDVTCCSADSAKASNRGTQDSHTKPIDVYGAEHLIRMLYMLPQLLVMPMESKESIAEQKYYSLVKESLEEFKIVFEELIRFIVEEKQLTLPVSCTKIDDPLRELDAQKDFREANQEILKRVNDDEIHTTPEVMNRLGNAEIVTVESDMIGKSSDLSKSAVVKDDDSSEKKAVLYGFKGPKDDNNAHSSKDIRSGNDLLFESVTPLITKKRKECDRDDDNSEISLHSPSPFEMSDSDDEAPPSDKRRKIIKDLEIKKIAACSHSWMCLKCSVLNSQKARSCDVCGVKKPPVQIPPKRKPEDDVYLLNVKQKKRRGRKPKIKEVVLEEFNSNDIQNISNMKDVDIELESVVQKNENENESKDENENESKDENEIESKDESKNENKDENGSENGREKVLDDIINDSVGNGNKDEEDKSEVAIKAEMIAVALAAVVAVVQIDDQLIADSGS